MSRIAHAVKFVRLCQWYYCAYEPVYCWLFLFLGDHLRYSRKNNGLWKSINTGFSGMLFSCFFYCPNAGNGFEDKYFMQKGREENECKKQKMFSKDSCIAEAEAEP